MPFNTSVRRKELRAQRQRRRLIVDTDGGFDDLAAMLFMYNFGLKIDLVTTVHGMRCPNDGAESIRDLLAQLQGLHTTKVVSGHRYHLSGERCPSGISPGHSAYISKLREERQLVRLSDNYISDEDAPRALIDAVNHVAPGTYTLVCIGPLTNIARAVELQRDFLHKFEQVIIMGGALHVDGHMYVNGNGPIPEFNFWSDPMAAHIVLEANSPNVILLPVDGCCQLTDRDIHVLRSGPKGKDFVCDMLYKLIEVSNGLALQYDTLIPYYLHESSAFNIRPRTRVTLNDTKGYITESDTGKYEVTLLLGLVDTVSYRDHIHHMLLCDCGSYEADETHVSYKH